MRGRKPKPTAQKRLEGNPGKRRLPTDEPAPPASPERFTDPPELVDPPRACEWPPYALREWRRLAVTCPQWITDVDRGILLACCILYARYLRAEQAIWEHGPLRAGKHGDALRSTDVLIADRTFLLYCRACTELGLTPSARSRIHLDGGGDGEPLPAGTAGDDYRGFVQ